MRIHRVALRDFRGVTNAEILLANKGVTVIEGPNEVGKSSIAEAIDLLFEQPDSSTRAAVKAVKPVHTDVGAQVEVELTTGAYRVVYAKRWHSQPQTVLHVLAPTPDNLTGRAAHDRMREILAETLDEALWKALRHQQGVAITQAAIGGSPSLTAALDAAASGTTVAGTRELDLWEQVTLEWGRYFTPGGRPSADRSRLGEQVASDRVATEDLRRSVAGLELTAELHRTISAEIAEIEGQRTAQQRLLEERSDAWRHLETLQTEADKLRSAADVATARAGQVRSAAVRRQEMVEELRAASEKVEQLEALSKRRAPVLETARVAEELARVARTEAREELRRAEEASELATRDDAHLERLASLKFLRERHARVQEAETAQGEALAFLERCPINPARLEEIEAAYIKAVEARARRSGESAAIHLEAIGEVSLEIDGSPRSLGAGEIVDAPVGRQLELSFPGLARVVVTGGATTREVEEDADAAEERLAMLLSVIGVSGDDALARSRELERRRQEAEKVVTQSHRALAENLGDLTPQLLAEAIERTNATTDAYLTARSSVPALPADPEAAARIREEAAAALRDASAVEGVRQDELDQASEELKGVQLAAAEHEATLGEARHALLAGEASLAEARATTPDDGIEDELRTLESAEQGAGAAWRVAAEQLVTEDPEGISELLANATSVLGRLETEHHDLEIRLTKARSELDILGDTGLHDQLDAAWTRLARHEQEKALLDRRVEAAVLLHETLARHRDASKRAYAEPFRQELERLGRVVFGASLSIQLDHETLQIVSRTLDGVTIPYESLSTGAREQLCLLSRIACALLVSPATAGSTDAGVPVVIDDALGYSDHARLERLGAVLNMAGRQSQVIVFTCVPERYRNVGVVTVVRLEPARLGEGTQAISTLAPLLGGAANADSPTSTRSTSADAGGPDGLDNLGTSPRRPGGAGATSDAGEQVLAVLRDAGVPLAKAEVLARVDVPEAMWGATIGTLVSEGLVVQHGRKRGTRYEAVPNR